METRGLQRAYEAGGRTPAGVNDCQDLGYRLTRSVRHMIRNFDAADDRERKMEARRKEKELAIAHREAAKKARANPVEQPGFLRRLWRRMAGERAA